MARVQLVKERDQLKMLVKCTYEPMLGLCFEWIYKACMYSGSQIICGDGGFFYLFNGNQSIYKLACSNVGLINAYNMSSIFKSLFCPLDCVSVNVI